MTKRSLTLGSMTEAYVSRIRGSFPVASLYWYYRYQKDENNKPDARQSYPWHRRACFGGISYDLAEAISEKRLAGTDRNWGICSSR